MKKFMTSACMFVFVIAANSPCPGTEDGTSQNNEDQCRIAWCLRVS
jgi:hypothetical protein